MSSADAVSLGLDNWIRNIINWKSQGLITNDTANRALDWIVDHIPDKKDELSNIITKYKAIGESQTLLLWRIKEPTNSEHNLLASFQGISIPSEELLSICTSEHVLDRSYSKLSQKCDFAMDIMMREYCPNSQYSFTLCRDKRVDQFYNIVYPIENIPKPELVSKINESIKIKQLNLAVTGFSTLNTGTGSFNIQIEVNLENLSSERVYISAEDFTIIDEKGNILNINDFIGSTYQNGNYAGSYQVEKVLPNQKLETTLFGVTTWYEGNILKITIDDETRYIALKRE